tara:strand:- start:206 stop:424 length:219 start_codon:yes stop_codon:yes gene_type:complete
MSKLIKENTKNKDINDLNTLEHMEYQTHNATTEFMNLITELNKLPPEYSQHITQMFSRILQAKPKDNKDDNS